MSDRELGSSSSLSEKHPLRITLRDVAIFAGVSTKTVSRVVNNQGEISEKTRHRVQDAIDQLGYHPNILARSLVNNRTNTLAVVAWGIDYFGPSRVLVGIENQANKLGYSLFLNLLCKPDDPNQDSNLDTLVSHRVDGIIWAVPEVGNNRAWLEQGRLEHLPPIVFLTMAPRPGFEIVAVDNQNGARQATQHLIDQGRSKIGIITGPMTWWESRERYSGWKTALEQAHLTPSPSLVVESEWSASGGEQAMRKLLMQEPHIDGLFASSDQIALGSLRVVHELDWCVPQDLAIAGFDNIPESEFFWPPLTTVYQQLSEVGRIAVQALHATIEANRRSKMPNEASVRLVKPDLIVRASSLRA
ncbi:MAG TPA: LacI family DNA-binding transcriptional regulator [Anaerolineaceae bacterium]|nr:LacI family DNA-binding transcriptional regulator [Anaerolineaceae bacterium]